MIMVKNYHRFLEKIKDMLNKIWPKGHQPKRKLIISGPRKTTCEGEC